FNIDCPEGPVLWLSADPNPGTVPANSTVGLNVNFDATELEEGVYNASVDISHDGGKNTTVIPVTIEIGTANPILSVDPTSLFFGPVVEGTTGSDIVTLSNAGSGAINFTATLDYGAKSIDGSYMETFGTFSPGATQTITFNMWSDTDDNEWVTYGELAFPAGFTINSLTDFVGTWDVLEVRGIFGQEAQWGDSGTYALGYTYWDYLSADVNVTSDAGLTTDQTIEWYMFGEDYNAEPHGVSGTFLLPLFVDPTLSWCDIDVTGGTLGAPIDITVSYDATDLPGGYYTCDLVITDDIAKGVTVVPITLAVYEWDHVALDPDPVLALEQNATGPRSGFAYIGELNVLDGSHAITDVTGATVNGMAATIGMGTHPLVQGTALEVEFDLVAFAASYGWPSGIEVETYDVELTFSDMSTFTVSDEFDFAGHISGDVNASGEIDIADLVLLVNYMFNGGPAPEVMAAADIDGNCTGPDIGDLIRLVNYMFNGGDAPGYCPN
ncbi:MAG: dockerin type I domain-containing protein, partial [bacterium]